jgi:hypothetical protein
MKYANIISFVLFMLCVSCGHKAVEECRDTVTDSIRIVNDSIDREFDRLYKKNTSAESENEPKDSISMYYDSIARNFERYCDDTISIKQGDTSVILKEYILKNKYLDIFSKALYDGRYGNWSLKSRFGCITIDTIYSKSKFVISVYTATLDNILQLYVWSHVYRYGYYKLNNVHFILDGDKREQKALRHLFRKQCNEKKFIFSKDCYTIKEPCFFDPYQWFFLYDNGNLSEMDR